ncbi:MAG TPA: gamma-glutamyl-gamma-aminobutyrate hydrolase family protein [Rudaea sp.]|jgi:putative glutamine amidotransferase|nr:gamma-glutamyl-gamma-aminobutyrate hydrolase family protein [Rudaea sp.]
MINVAVNSRLWRGRSDAQGAQRQDALTLSAALSDAVTEAGASAWLLPPLRVVDSFDAWTERFDALILQGGRDIAPELYGELAATVSDAEHDRLEIALLDRFIAARKPVLGLCRGCQLINVAFGGSLYQDLPSELRGAQNHSDPQRYVELEHDVELVRGGYLHRLYGTEKGIVNSAHHQGIRTLGRDLQVDATSSDGLVEAVRWRGPGYVVGLQWHPEFDSRRQTPLARNILFADFVETAARAKREIVRR